MTNKEFSNQFETLYNNITSNKAPGLNTYEKSVLLTKAQDEIIKNHFNGGASGQNYDSSRKRQIDFSMITDNENLSVSSNTTKYDPRSLVYLIPNKVLFILNEQIYFEDSSHNVIAQRQVIPLHLEEYTRLMSKPFKEPLKNQAWRLMVGSNGVGSIVEIIITTSDNHLISSNHFSIIYNMRYIIKPQPIILSDFNQEFGADVTIGGYHGNESNYSNSGSRTEWDPCILDTELHEEILQRAVELAKIAWLGTSDEVTKAGARSE